MSAEYAVSGWACAKMRECQPHRSATAGQAVLQTLAVGGVVAGALLSPAVLGGAAAGGALVTTDYAALNYGTIQTIAGYERGGTAGMVGST